MLRALKYQQIGILGLNNFTGMERIHFLSLFSSVFYLRAATVGFIREESRLLRNCGLLNLIQTAPPCLVMRTRGLPGSLILSKLSPSLYCSTFTVTRPSISNTLTWSCLSVCSLLCRLVLFLEKYCNLRLLLIVQRQYHVL